tara:strand:+ start:151 stop:429 length:279 start_codon:yes stop_codon:yes gene_type:complete
MATLILGALVVAIVYMAVKRLIKLALLLVVVLGVYVGFLMLMDKTKIQPLTTQQRDVVQKLEGQVGTVLDKSVDSMKVAVDLLNTVKEAASE